MSIDLLNRKLALVIDIIKETKEPLSASERAGFYAASRLLMDDIENGVKSPEFRVHSGTTSVSYVLEQVSSLRSYIYYHLGYSNFTDVPPGTSTENALHYAYKLKGHLPNDPSTGTE